MTAGGPPPSVSLFHPFTARSIGWADDDDLARVHSRPHVDALRSLAADGRVQPRVEYLTDRLRPRVVHGDVTRRFWPRTTRWRRRSAQYRWEWSTPALASVLLAPAEVTILNMSGHGSPLTRALAAALRLRRRPHIAMLGGFEATLSGAQLAFLQRATACAVHTHDLAGRVVDAGVAADRVVVVPLGVDPSHYEPGPLPTRPTLLYIGRFQEWKGLHHLVAALPAVRAAAPDVLVRLVGPGHDGPYADRLRADAERLGVGDALSIEGPVPHAEVPALHRSATLFVLPSEGEGFGMVMLEAMASGLPVVGLSVGGGPSEVVTDGVDGALTTVAGLGATIAGLLLDGGRLAELRTGARRTVEQRYTSAVTAAAFADLVDRCTAVR